MSLLVGLTFLVTATDLYFSTQNGVLAGPLRNDGISYVMDAKSLFYHLLNDYNGHFTYWSYLVPLWLALMLLSWGLLGVGEWQAYTVRFWPILLLLLLMWWVVRRNSSGRVAWVSVILTALLPAVSPSVSSNVLMYLSSRITMNDLPPTWYLGDLRPDLLFAVLVLWTIVLIVECSDNDPRAWIVSGTCAATAVLVKASGLPEIILVLSFVLVSVLLLNRTKTRLIFVNSLAALVPLVIFLGPWAAMGGLSRVIRYLWLSMFTARRLYYVYSAPLLSQIAYYWNTFSLHTGLEGWILLAAAVSVTIFYFARRREARQKGTPGLVYLWIALALYLLISAAPTKSWIIGLPFSLLLWVFSWRTISPHLQRFIQHKSGFILVILLLGTYSGLYFVGSANTLQNWPKTHAVEAENFSRLRSLTQQIAKDLRGYLNNSDCFVVVSMIGYPAGLAFYMMDKYGGTPTGVANWAPDLSVEQVIQNASKCRAILSFDEDIGVVAHYYPLDSIRQRYLRGIAQWVRESNSSYRAVNAYLFPARNHEDLTLRLFVTNSHLSYYPSSYSHEPRFIVQVVAFLVGLAIVGCILYSLSSPKRRASIEHAALGLKQRRTSTK